MRLLLSTIISIIIFSSVSFGNEVDDLSRFSDSANINIKIIVNGKYDTNEMTKELIRNKSTLNSIRTDINREYNNSKDLNSKDELERLLYIVSAFDVSVTNQLLYLQDKNSNQNNFTDAIYYFYEGNYALNRIK